MNRELRKASSALLCTRISQGGSYAVMSLSPSPVHWNAPANREIKSSSSMKNLLNEKKKYAAELSI